MSDTTPAATSACTRAKRARANTDSDSSPATTQSTVISDPEEIHRAAAAPASDTRGPKRRKEDTTAAADPQDDEDAEATDGGVSAAAARVRRAGKTRLLSGEEKRARFLAKYPGKTPEQILGTSAMSNLLTVC